MRFILIAMLVGLGVLLSLTPIIAFDAWTHLAAGRLIGQNLSVPSHDPFSWALAGAPWVDHEWLFQVFAWLVYALAGVPALIIAKTLVLLAAFFLLLLTVYNSDTPVLSSSLVALAVLASYPRFQVRPEVVSLLFLVLFLFILERVRGGRAPWLLWLLLPLQFLWANIHAYFIIGNVVLTAYLVGELLAHIRLHNRSLSAPKLPNPALRILAAVWALSFIVTLLTPGLLAGALYPYKTLFLASSGPMKRITELMPPLDSLHTTWVRVWLVLVFLSLLSLFLRGLNFFVSDVLLLLLSLFASWKASRNVPFFAVIAVLVAARQLSAVLLHLRTRFKLDPRPWFRFVLRPLVALLLVAFFAFQLFRGGTDRLHLEDVSARSIGLDVSEKFSLDSLDFLERSHLDGNLLNSFAIGGFIAFGRYPHNLVSIDGRVEIYPPDEFLRLNALLTGDYPMPTPAVGGSPDVIYLGLASAVGRPLTRLLANPDFKLVFADHAAAIFVRTKTRPDLPPADLDALAASVQARLDVKPSQGLFATRTLDWKPLAVISLFQAANRLDLADKISIAWVDRYPYAATPRLQRAFLHLASRRTDDALASAMEAYKLDPDLPRLAACIARCNLILGHRDEGLRWLERARAQARHRLDELRDLGELYLAAQLPTHALQCLRPVYNEDPSLPTGILCVRALLQAGDRATAQQLAADLARRFPNDPRLAEFRNLTDPKPTR